MVTNPDDRAIEAWNNFVTLSDPSSFSRGSRGRAAAIANQVLGMVNNGGFNSYLTCSYDLAAQEVLDALGTIGASLARDELKRITDELDPELLASSQQERWDILNQQWTDKMNEYEFLSIEADNELILALERYVAENEDFYLTLDPHN